MPKIKQAISHDIWCPTSKQRINGKKIAIVGYSHYHNEGQEDRASLTREVVGNVVNASEKHAFFTKIRDAFGYKSHEDFWPRVYFFNFLPSSVGTPDHMYCAGDELQTAEAQNRFLRYRPTSACRHIGSCGVVAFCCRRSPWF